MGLGPGWQVPGVGGVRFMMCVGVDAVRAPRAQGRLEAFPIK